MPQLRSRANTARSLLWSEAMLRRALPLLLVGILASCVAPADEEEATAVALSGGADLDSFVNAAKEDGDIEGVKFVPASPSAFQVGRPGEINYVVIHDIEGAGRSAVNTFRGANTETSAHYVVDKNGKSVQVVREQDIANHAFHSVFNAYAIGIEHAGFAAQDGYTDAEYDESARLVASIVTRYHIPIDRQHILGHHQVPKKDTDIAACAEDARTCGGKGGHADPGPNWDWASYMKRIEKKAAALGYVQPTRAEQAKRDLQNKEPMQTLTSSKRLFGGYYATECDANDPSKQITYRIIGKANETPRFESRYIQSTVGECGDKTDGAYPLIVRGFPVNPSEGSDLLDLRGVTLKTCVSNKAYLFEFRGDSVSCSRDHGDCKDPVLALVSKDEDCN